MPICFYNTLTRKKEEFVPRTQNMVSMYTCGPTVYDYFHIGNARSFVMSDIVRRYFEYKGYEVTYIVNLTDIEDRIINRANAEGIDASILSNRYADAYFEDITRLKIKKATVNPRATESVKEIIEHIEGLIANGSAYQVDGDVYFRVESFPEYGKLSGKKIEDLMIGARVEADERKQNPVDFALWKAAKKDEPWWDSPWGKGRPGWHIECSVMSRKYLGDSFDIHAGGNDLIFPHHENEIAQSEALIHKSFARYWMHFGFLNIDNEKMSKSLGNFFTTRGILEKYEPEVLRFFYLQTHYRGPINFAEEGLDAAEKGLQKLDNIMSILETMQNGSLQFDVDLYRKRFEEAMDDDLNTPMAIGVIFELIKELNVLLVSGDGLDEKSKSEIKSFLTRTCDDLFGIKRAKKKTGDDKLFNDVMKVILNARSKARSEKQWILADYIREELGKIGIVIEDGKQETKWKVI